MVPANQGSRGALITWTVVTTILFVTATIFAIYYFVLADRVGQEARTTADKFRKVVTEPQLTAPELADLEAAKTNETLGFNGSMTLMDVALKQRDDLAKSIGSAKFEQAIAASKKLLVDAPAKVASAGAAKLDTSNLEGLVTSLTDGLAASQGEVNKLREDLTAAQKAQEQAGKELAIAREAMDKQLAEVRASEKGALDSSAADRTAKEDQVKQIEAAFQEQIRLATESQQQAQVQLADLQRANDQLKSERERINNKLTGLRVNVTDPIVRQADGQIVRLPGGDVVYINLGQGDQLSPGITFQVFDKTEGIPALGDSADAENVQRGKASIEVIRVGPTSSECRVIRVQPGQTLTEGDLITNLVYDRNTRYNFLVFGNFDLDRNAVPTAADAEVVKRLVTQWGGRLTDKVNVDTDFVVLGAEPEIPAFSRDELQDPINQAKFDQSRADSEAYDEVRRLAQDYNVPILNQNRFLYFVGFYELSKR